MLRTLLVAALLTMACDASARDVPINSRNAGEPGEGETASQDSDAFTPSSIDDFAGSWEAVSEDGTSMETAEIEIDDGAAVGILKSLERGYFSGRVTVKAQAAMRGTLDRGVLVLRVWDTENGSEASAVSGRAFRRGEYLVVQAGSGETSYAREGVPLVGSAEGSPSALTLANAIGGRIYSSSNQASGRGAFVGGRVRLALCADGSIEYDESDVASTGGSDGVDMGSTMSRRGQWSIVLFAGLPAVQAQWSGTGTSYSLTRYFRVEPRSNGARVDGRNLAVAGSC